MAPSRLVSAHIEAQRRLRLSASAAVERIWRSLPGYDESDVDQWLASVVPLVLAAQRLSVNVTDAYVARAMDRQPFGIDPGEVIGALRGGTSPEEVYRRPFVTLWSALKDGTQFQDAFDAGLARSTSTAEMDVQLASRATFGVVQREDDGIYGYQRVADGGACDFCQAVDGAYVKEGDASPLHNRCGCSLEPLTEPHPRARYLPSGESVHDSFAIREHGELGAVLTDPADSFLTEAEALKR